MTPFDFRAARSLHQIDDLFLATQTYAFNEVGLLLSEELFALRLNRRPRGEHVPVAA